MANYVRISTNHKAIHEYHSRSLLTKPPDDRQITSVINYARATETSFKREIREYEVTDAGPPLRASLNNLRTLPLGRHEIGVWVSGFYGSGKPFTNIWALLSTQTEAQG